MALLWVAACSLLSAQKDQGQAVVWGLRRGRTRLQTAGRRWPHPLEKDRNGLGMDVLVMMHLGALEGDAAAAGRASVHRQQALASQARQLPVQAHAVGREALAGHQAAAAAVFLRAVRSVDWLGGLHLVHQERVVLDTLDMQLSHVAPLLVGGAVLVPGQGYPDGCAWGEPE